MRFLTLIILFLYLNTFAQKSEIFHIDSLPTEGVLLDKGWKFHVGDNPDFAKAEFDDSAWESIDPTKMVPELNQVNTDKPLWLRLKFTSEISQEVIISIIQSGATEIFLNGKPSLIFGQIDNGNKPTIAYDPQNNASVLKLDTAMNILAVRYFFQKDMRYNSVFNVNFPLFSARINNKISQTNINKYAWNGFNVGVPLILFIVHFIFFLSYTRNKTNLWYSLSSLFGCIGAFLLFKVDITHSIESKNHLTNYAAFAGAFQNIFVYYTIFLFLKHKNKWLVLVFIGIVLFSFLLNSFDYFQSSVLVNYIITLFYVCSVIYMGNQAWKQGEKGGKYLILSMVFYIIFWSLFILSFNFTWGNSSHDILFHIATLIIPIIISVLLGLDFRNTNNSLLKNLEKVNALSIEKQQILATQNETLEKQVKERTAELVASQTQLIQKEKLASLGELTAGIAHEIQNPLNFVNNFSELSVDLVKDLKDEINKPDIDKEYVGELFTDLSQNQEKINHHGKRASSIVKGMLEHSRTSTGIKELTDINKLADEYLRLSYHGLRAKDKEFNADYELIVDENLPKIEVIPQDMGRVLLNLINNAFYAVNQRKQQLCEDSKPSQSLSIYTPSVSITTKQLDNQIIIKVKDNGTGMPESVRAKVFQPFFTTKPTGQGTGLGLSLAYDIVTKGHGGALEVESTEGVGSEFIITLNT